jgi:transcription antitermination factor NusG
VKKYGGKTVIFLKPLFPGYVFIQTEPYLSRKVYHSHYVANLLDVTDQELFVFQLEQIMEALSKDVEVVLAPSIQVGTRVRIKAGPLRGVEGLVESRQGIVQVFLRLDFISQAAAVKVDASELEVL